MSHIVSIHSFRGGTGKSNITANLATLLAAAGRRVGVIDTDIQSPGIHILFGLHEGKISYTLNDYLWSHCTITQTAYNVTPSFAEPSSGAVFLIPSNLHAGEITKILRQGYDVTHLNEGFHALINAYHLDVLMIDTHPGLNEETLLSIAISDTLVVLLRPDQQDYQGTSVTVDIARRLHVPRLMLVVNKMPTVFDPVAVKARLESIYNCDVVTILPHCDEMMTLASADLFVLRYPQHPITAALRHLASTLLP